jgi:hypothetical protein
MASQGKNLNDFPLLQVTGGCGKLGASVLP